MKKIKKKIKILNVRKFKIFLINVLRQEKVGETLENMFTKLR